MAHLWPWHCSLALKLKIDFGDKRKASCKLKVTEVKQTVLHQSTDLWLPGLEEENPQNLSLPEVRLPSQPPWNSHVPSCKALPWLGTSTWQGRFARLTGLERKRHQSTNVHARLTERTEFTASLAAQEPTLGAPLLSFGFLTLLSPHFKILTCIFKVNFREKKIH